MKTKLLVLTLALTTSATALADTTTWTKLSDPSRVRCLSSDGNVKELTTTDKNGVTTTTTQNVARYMIGYKGKGFMSGVAVLYQNSADVEKAAAFDQACQNAVAQATDEGKAVFVSSDGQVKPEDGFYVHESTCKADAFKSAPDGIN